MMKKKKEEKKDLKLNDLVSIDSESNGISEFKELIDKFFSSENLELKTEIDKPLNWSTFLSFIDFFDEKKFPNSIKLLKNFQKYTFILNISKKRKSREEFVKILSSSGLRIEDNESNGRNINIEDFM